MGGLVRNLDILMRRADTLGKFSMSYQPEFLQIAKLCGLETIETHKPKPEQATGNEEVMR